MYLDDRLGERKLEFRENKKNVGVRQNGWENPKEGYDKLNVDASFLVGSCSGDTGLVIQAYRGSFIACGNYGIASISDAAMAEAIALRDGLLLASQVGSWKLEC